jgi:hypothetical protein
MNPRGFPHSEIPGSKLVCSSPGLIAAYRVLHRLLAPRHSPYALSSLTTSVSNSRWLSALGLWLSASSNVSSISSHTACYLTTPEAARDRDREPPQGGLPDSVFEKNYRLQDIQLSKNLLALGSRLLALSLLALAFKLFRQAAITACLAEVRFVWRSSHHTSAERRLVENTGLEPVTSWLQTRRSPS